MESFTIEQKKSLFVCLSVVGTDFEWKVVICLGHSGVIFERNLGNLGQRTEYYILRPNKTKNVWWFFLTN